MGGCLGCYKEPKFDPLMNDTSKGLEVPGQTVRKTSISEDFWTTSACDMDNSAVQSQGSISSISVSNQSLDPHGNANSPSEFVNHGLLLWNRTRQQWIGNKKSKNRPQKVREPKLSIYGLSMVNPFWPCSWNATYESLLGNNKPFPQPIPLPEMIDFLVDIWEQEGLYD
ncbi:hypothetical protein E1A91_D09G101600v1 [Gossypium mustelinum]|uniref:Uncharacterized protein LOC107891677 isoform X1 n=4 Tax=Gossypium TaxID=3633 RepID=A0A1U8I1A0_GOSHI|nr:uncharacterized protein LOC107891677 isoform X1 [Gossypium hirsutum]XP_016672018.1 uncharacterized protein LOC107891677 isoform X1 [Gossypium hirsutum]TYI64630.1 hypothetical protein E1A91_D09G101600v1 [Gossypium mustelinum]TYI64633.1 hypothetical protein E1A91_D09G101600v1 [Gossypium mustelinum]